jgi:hypothetical protein
MDGKNNPERKNIHESAKFDKQQNAIAILKVSEKNWNELKKTKKEDLVKTSL